MKKPRVAFFGTPLIAKECLETIHKLDVEVVLVVCQPDKAKNRKNEFIFCDVKKYSLENNLFLLQPEKINDIFDEIKKLDLDIIITCAFGQFIGESILNLPKYKCVNIHASLLPKLRGGAPIHWAIINNLKETGISLMFMSKKMDAGNIIKQESISISKSDTYDILLLRLTELAKKIINENFFSLLNDKVQSIAQIESEVTFGYNIKKAEEFINFNQSIELVDCQIRGLFSKPMAKFKYNNEIYKLYEAVTSNIKSITPPGTINKITKEGMYVSTFDYDIIIMKIQQPNKSPLTINQMINGNHEFVIKGVLNG